MADLIQAFAGLRQAATERKYGWPRDSIRHNFGKAAIYKRGFTRPITVRTFLNFGKKKKKKKKKDPAARQAWTEESSPSEARNTSGTYKLDAKENARAGSHMSKKSSKKLILLRIQN